MATVPLLTVLPWGNPGWLRHHYWCGPEKKSSLLKKVQRLMMTPKKVKGFGRGDSCWRTGIIFADSKKKSSEVKIIPERYLRAFFWPTSTGLGLHDYVYLTEMDASTFSHTQTTTPLSSSGTIPERLGTAEGQLWTHCGGYVMYVWFEKYTLCYNANTCIHTYIYIYYLHKLYKHA